MRTTFLIPERHGAASCRLSTRTPWSARLLHMFPVILVAAWVGTVLAGWRPFRVVLPLPRQPVGSDAPRITHLDGNAPGPEDVRYICSPVLFALPGPFGFSAPLQVRTLALAGLPELPAPPVFMLPSPDIAPPVFGETRQQLTDLIQEPRPQALPYPAEDSPTAPALSTRPPAYSVYWQDRPSEALPELAMPAVPATTNGQPWQAVFLVAFNTGGGIDHALIEKPGPDAAINQALAYVVRSLRMTAPPPVAWRRLVIQYQPARQVDG